MTLSRTIAPAPDQNTICHENLEPISPLRVRESRMPINRPLITIPTTLPRPAPGTRPAAYGTASCGVTEVNPTAKLESSIIGRFGAKGIMLRATEEKMVVPMIRCFRSTLSPIGSTNRSPAAYPSCVAVATQATAEDPILKLSAISFRIGWL
jgi:hypothetical protein